MASVKNVNTDYTINVGSPAGNGVLTINAQTVFNGNVTYNVPSVTSSPFLTVAANNTGALTDMGLIAQLSPNTFAGFRFDTTANTWQISSSVYANGAPITPYANMSTPPAGSNTQIQFNNGGIFGATANLTYDQATNLLNLSGNANISGNIRGGNVLTTGLISVGGNALLGNVLTPGLIQATGNISGNYILGNGAFLTGITASGGNSSITVSDWATGNIISNTIANVQYLRFNTSTGISVSDLGNNSALVSLGSSFKTWEVDGQANLVAVGEDVVKFVAGNGIVITTNANTVPQQIQFAVGGNITGNTVSSLGNITGGNIITGGTVSSSGNVVGGNITTGGTVSSTGNIIAGNITTGGNVSATGHAMVGNLITDGDVSSTGNISGGNIITGGIVSSSGNVVGGNITTGGTVSSTGNVSGGNVTSGGTISSVGNVSGGNINTGGTVSSAGNITGSNINTGGTVSSAGNVTGGNLVTTGTVSSTGNVTSGNVLTGGIVSSTGNVTGGNLITGGIVLSTGNIIGGNIVTSGSVSSTGNITTSGYISATSDITSNANISGGNVYTSGVVSSTGNIYGSYGIFSNGNTVINSGVSTSGNVSGNFIFGNGYYLTGISGGGGGGNTGNITFSNTTISTNITDANINLSPTGNGIVVIANTVGGATGIQLGSNTVGQLVSNALTLTNSTSITNGIALLNQVLGRLVPPSPPLFPASTSLSITSSTTSARMCSGFVQPNNTTTGNKTVPAGTVVNVLRSATYSTNTISNAGPGDSGTIVVYLNSVNSGNVTLNTSATPTGNGTHGNLVITNNEDYHYVNGNVNLGFWYIFSSQATGSAPSGWNEVYIADTAASNTNTIGWYYDASTAPAPVFSSTSFTACASPSLTYSSTIPHYNTGTNFILQFNVNNLSGNMYPNNGNLLTNTTTAGGAFQAPVTVSYSTANVTVPLSQNLYVGSGNATANTTATITTGFGSSNVGPQISVTNSYNSTSYTFNPTGNVLYKTGTSTAIEESNIVIGSTIGSGSGNAYRIVNPGTGNTPVFTGSEAAFNSQTGPFYSYDATVVGSGTQGVLKFNQTNYSSGYLPAGPNLSTQGSTQWFTFKFVRSATSKFDIQITGTVGGVWVALPGSVFDTNVAGVGPTSDINGWLTMGLPYNGSGRPGAIIANGGNGSDGCAIGGVIPLNTAINGRYTCTFGTVSSSSTSSNEIYIRIRLTSGQSITGLTLQTASN